MEIWVPEAMVVLFLALPLIRPFIKALWPLDGLIWLPLLGLGITVGIFPAYGFRPECLPMLVFVLIYNIANTSTFFSSIVARPSDSFRDRGPLSVVCVLMLLAAAAIPMFVFPAKVYPGLEAEAEPVRVLKINAPYNRNRAADKNYFMRIYDGGLDSTNSASVVEPNRPLIFLVPPEIGSAVSVNFVCAELQKRGYTVVTYFHEGYDTPLIDEDGKKGFVSLAKLLTYLRIFKDAADLASANEQGKALENQRQAEIEYLLPLLPTVLNIPRNSVMPPLLLAGYGAGGSALAYLAGESGFISRYDNVLGVVAIESRLWSLYLPKPRDLLNPPQRIRQDPLSYYYWTRIVTRLYNILPQPVGRQGTLPSTEPPASGFPVLYLVSGKALDSEKGQKPYEAVFHTFQSGSGPVALAAIEGAGPLDYQDFPFTHPVCSFLLPGLKNAQKSENPVSDTAGIIGNFASLLLERAKTESIVPPRHDIGGALYVESKGIPGFWL